MLFLLELILNKGLIVLNLFRVLAQIYLIFIISWYMPFYYKISNSSVLINLDLIILFLTIQSITMKRYQLIMLGLLLGFLIDLDLEQNLIGLNSFFFSLFCYFLGLIKIHADNWTFKIKIMYLFSIYFLMFFNKFIFYSYQFNFYDFISISINSCLVLLVFLSVDRFYYKKRVIY